jgi:hypothetical protein
LNPTESYHRLAPAQHGKLPGSRALMESIDAEGAIATLSLPA